MEDIFCVTHNFFPQPPQQRGWQGDQPPQQPGQIGQEVADFQCQDAEGQEVGRRPGQNPQQRVDAYHPAARPEGVDKQGRCHRNPEQQIQNSPQEGEPYPHPEDPEDIVQQAHQRPQYHRAGKAGRLSGDRQIHLSGTGGRTGRPAPGLRPHRSKRQSPPPP